MLQEKDNDYQTDAPDERRMNLAFTTTENKVGKVNMTSLLRYFGFVYFRLNSSYFCLP